jgi:hypothetical protein
MAKQEAEKASHQMVQVTDEHQEPNVLVAGTIPSDPGEAASAMNTDLPQTIGESGTKRKAEDTSSPDERKKARIGQSYPHVSVIVWPHCSRD